MDMDLESRQKRLLGLQKLLLGLHKLCKWRRIRFDAKLIERLFFGTKLETQVGVVCPFSWACL